MGRIAGTTTIIADNMQLSLKGSITLAVSDNERESVMGLDGRHGWKETKVTPFVEVTVSLTEELDLQQISAVENATIQVKLANGKAAIFSGAVQTKQPELNPEEGEVTLRFEATSASYAKQ